tara:strand:+ start:20945 stop:21154 length:210 start_codon:yes stop_codon:yes gene_type:complete
MEKVLEGFGCLVSNKIRFYWHRNKFVDCLEKIKIKYKSDFNGRVQFKIPMYLDYMGLSMPRNNLKWYPY